MDREPEELQFVGLLGLYREAVHVLTSWRRLFTQIALALILPLSFLFLAHIGISYLIFSRIDRSEAALEDAPPGSPSEHRLLDALSSEFVSLILFKAVYLLVLLSLLSTAAIVYSVASIYTAKELSFPKVMAVVPKVWRRLMATFIWAFLIMLAYNIVALLVVLAFMLLAGPGTAGVVVLLLLTAAYAAGLVWISVVWHVASVVSVLEDAKGIAAMRKSRDLIRGKTWIAVAVFVKLNLCFVAVELAFRWLVVEGGHRGLGVGPRLLLGALMLALLCVVLLVALVVQTVVYFVCKSYHHESIDKSSLADHLEVYLGEYVPLKAKDVQMEAFDL